MTCDFNVADIWPTCGWIVFICFHMKLYNIFVTDGWNVDDRWVKSGKRGDDIWLRWSLHVADIGLICGRHLDEVWLICGFYVADMCLTCDWHMIDMCLTCCWSVVSLCLKFEKWPEWVCEWMKKWLVKTSFFLKILEGGLVRILKLYRGFILTKEGDIKPQNNTTFATW